jgi:hypothetical protein
MFKEKFPIFEKDMILKADMLTELKEYPRSMFQLQFQDYSDGILSGARVVVNEEYLVVTPGMIKRNGRLYHMEQEIKVPYEAAGIEMCLKLKFLEEEQRSDFNVCRSEILLEKLGQMEADEMELCRFTLKKGALLRQDYQNFSDFATLHNTINVIHVNHAGVKYPTLSPEITCYFGKEMLRLNTENAYDVYFAMHCLENKQVAREVILSYLIARLKVKEELLNSNEKLHLYLGRVLENAEKGRKDGSFRDGRDRRMIVE